MHKVIGLIVLILTADPFRDAAAQTFPRGLQVLTDGHGLCLDVRGGAAENGTPVQSYACNGTAAQAWWIDTFGLTNRLPAGEGSLTTKNSAAVRLAQPVELWTLSGKQITHGDYCLNPTASGIQLPRRSCGSGSGWTAAGIVALLQGETLAEATANIPPIFMAKRDEMIVTVSNGLLRQGNSIFSSPESPPQSLQPPSTPSTPINCVIPGLGWAAWYTTYYVVARSGVIHMVNACGKDPILPGQNTAMRIMKGEFQMNHAALADATSVLGAGEVDVVNGRIVYIDNCSGHYRPTKYSLLFVINWLAGKGAQGLPTHGLRLNQLRWMKLGTGIAADIRAGTGDCWSYVPPAT
jgi:hypothetical protein